MLHKRRILAMLLSLTMLSSSVSQNTFAASLDTGGDKGALHYSISETVNEDKTESNITLEITETAGNHLKEVILPDRTVVSAEDSGLEIDGTQKYRVRYTAEKNGQIVFYLKYDSEVGATAAPKSEKPKIEVPVPEKLKADTPPASPSDVVADDEADGRIEAVPKDSEIPGKKLGDGYEGTIDTEPRLVEKVMPVRFNVKSLSTASLFTEGSYRPGSAKVEDVQIKQDGEDQSGIIASGGTMGLLSMLQLSLNPDAESVTSVWVGYRFELPKKTASGGTWEFLRNTYNWLLDKNDPTAVAKPVDDGSGNWVLEGVVLLRDGGNAVIPGSSARALTVMNKNGVEGETATLTGKVWLVADGEDSGLETRKKIGISSKPEFDLSKYLTESLFSAYVNTATGDFSLTKPEAGSGYVFGRIYGISGIVWSSGKGSEKLDPTMPITWDMSYKVVKNEGAGEIEETDPSLKPILLGIRRNGGKEFTENRLNSEMAGTLLGDMAMGGNIRPSFLDHNGMYNTPFYKGGDYSFTGGEGGVRTEVLLSAGDKNTGYNAAESVAILFVPLNPADSKHTTRKLVVKLSNLSATSYSGKAVTDVKDDGGNKAVFDVPRKDEGIGSGLFSRQIFEANGLKTIKIGNESILWSKLLTKEPGTLVDYNINAINILVKVETGFDLLDKNTDPSVRGYTGTSTVLWATKPDGSDWTDEKELNHTEDWELRYFDNFADAKSHGRVVGVLLELRGGIWSNESSLSFRPRYKAAGTTGTAYAAVQDVRIWRGDKRLTEADSYRGTNGAEVEKLADSSDLMVPYDNPSNDSSAAEADRVYRKDKWNSVTGTAEPVEDITWGYTIFPMGGEIIFDKLMTRPLNGSAIGTILGSWNKVWGISTYDVVSGERYADRTYGFTVSGMGDVPLNLKAVLDTKNYLSENKVKQVGAVYLSTKDNPVIYTSGSSPGMRGSFAGGKIIDINSFTVPGDGSYQLYYTSFIGDDANLSNDARVGVYWNQSKVDAVGKSTMLVNTREASAAMVTNVTKSTITGTRKTTLNPAALDEAGYRLTLHATAQQLNNVYVLDVLPFNGDGRGTQFHGTYTLKDGKIPMQLSATTGAPKSRMQVYYTTDVGIRTAGADGGYAKADIFSGKAAAELGNSFAVSGITFMMAADNTDGTWSVKDGDVPTAIIVCGTLIRDEQMAVTLQMKTADNQRGDVYINAASTGADEYRKPLESNLTEVTVVSRKISGKAWLDQDRNGLYGGADTPLAGVVVTLHRADGTLIASDADDAPYGIVKTAADGSYIFEKVPEFTDGYYVTFAGSPEFEIGRYEAAPKYAGGAVLPQTSEADSDTDATAERPLKYARTEVFSMLGDKELVAAEIPTQHYEGINAGFMKTPPPPASAYTVTYDANGGTGTMTDPKSPYLAAADVTVLNNTFSRSGYTFTGWNTAADNIGRTYHNGSTFSMPEGNVILFAQWSKDSTGGGGSGPAPVPVKSDPPVKKVVTGNPDTPGSFTFTLTPADPAFPMPEGSSDGKKEATVSGAGAYEFGDITFTKAGTYVYIITEKNNGQRGYSYDNASYTVTYVVTDNGGRLEAARAIKRNGQAADDVVFTNDYKKDGNSSGGGSGGHSGSGGSKPTSVPSPVAPTAPGPVDPVRSVPPAVPVPDDPAAPVPAAPAERRLDSVPKTEDTTKTAIPLALMIVSLAGLLLTVTLGRRKRYYGLHEKTADTKR